MTALEAALLRTGVPARGLDCRRRRAAARRVLPPGVGRRGVFPRAASSPVSSPSVPPPPPNFFERQLQRWDLDYGDVKTVMWDVTLPAMGQVGCACRDGDPQKTLRDAPCDIVSLDPLLAASSVPCFFSHYYSGVSARVRRAISGAFSADGAA